MSNPVFLKPPDGTEWKVHWIKKNDEFWLEKGWKEFTENYSLYHGVLVMFKYEGTSHFDVNILDNSSLEIEYPSYHTCKEEQNLDDSVHESVRILNDWENHKASERSPIPLASAQSSKKRKGEEATPTSLSMNWPREPRAQVLAKKFVSESDNPFFTKTMKPIDVVESRLSVPNMDGYIEKKNMNVTLEHGERSWKVKLLGSNNSACRRRFSAGWCLFASESELHPGDVCIFELINTEDIVFKVHVFKG
ncbi:putative transcription factor B3-Domain family [Lupinus albus]|uniref:Putative transcription factor B3-Domain family n=1 Tax=Lupinus albus TaxID=3870 RepID=A0A6A4QD59_LUPAL|nr:putative transcription factor B3-Domain family [Lupinus albus]